jgi:hypothetical protein
VESLETRASPAAAIPHCDVLAPRAVSAVLGRVKMGEVTRGKNGPPPPNALDTRPLAEGVSTAEWREGYRSKDFHKQLEGL